MNRIIIVPDTTVPMSHNTNSDSTAILGTFIAFLVVGGVGYSVWDRITNKSWWWKRMQYEREMRQIEGYPERSMISRLFMGNW